MLSYLLYETLSESWRRACKPIRETLNRCLIFKRSCTVAGRWRSLLGDDISCRGLNYVSAVFLSSETLPPERRQRFAGEGRGSPGEVLTQLMLLDSRFMSSVYSSSSQDCAAPGDDGSAALSSHPARATAKSLRAEEVSFNAHSTPGSERLN